MIKDHKPHKLIAHSLAKRKESYRSISNPKSVHHYPPKIKPRETCSIAIHSTKHQSDSFYAENCRYFVKLSPLSPVFYENVNNYKPHSSFLNFSKEKHRNIYDVVLVPKVSIIPKAQISIKKAMKNRGWLLHARESIMREFSTSLNASNGISIIPQESCYKYYVGKGNNSTLVKQVLSTRWWLTCVEEDHLPNVNLVWAQSVNSEYLSTITITCYKPSDANKILPQSITCKIPYVNETLERQDVDISSLGLDSIAASPSFVKFKEAKSHSPLFLRTHNKLENNQFLSDKKCLHFVMKRYHEICNTDPYGYMPLTFHVQGTECTGYKDFLCHYQISVINNLKNFWIIKPGENSNRGNGIVVSDNIHEIAALITSTTDKSHTYIIQKYIENPLLINKRKFDIRLYTLMTSINGVLQCYFYKEGYLRTACKEFNLHSLSNKFIHLTNDAIQKQSNEYGKFENGNKLSYSDFQRYLDLKNIGRNFVGEVLPEIKKIVKDTVMATFLKIDSKRRCHSFEIFGYDFLLDNNLKPWLLEVNTNPCLELSSSILVRLIPAMLENAIKIAVDPIFPEPLNIPKRIQNSFSQDFIAENKFELIFHEYSDGKEFIDLLKRQNLLESFLNT